jgi:hypothetical protein
MGKYLDRTGMIYGRLKVILQKGKDKKGLYLWECLCDCGNTKIVVGSNLSSGKSKSCGCLKEEFLAKGGNQFRLYKNRQNAMLKVQYSHLKRRNNKMIGNIMVFEQFVILSKSKCKYCGLEHSKEIKDRTNEKIKGKLLSNEILLINGIDRKDSSIGYTKENTVSCCKNCSFAKNTMSESDFYLWVKRIYEYNFK